MAFHVIDWGPSNANLQLVPTITTWKLTNGDPAGTVPIISNIRDNTGNTTGLYVFEYDISEAVIWEAWTGAEGTGSGDNRKGGLLLPASGAGGLTAEEHNKLLAMSAAVADRLDVAVGTRAAGSVWSSDLASQLATNLDAKITTRTAASVWTSTRAGYLDAAITSVGSGLGANYTAERAAKLDFLDAAISSRARNDLWTPQRASYLDAAVSSRAAKADYSAARAAKLDSLDKLDTTVSTRASQASVNALPGNLLDAQLPEDVTVGSMAEALAAALLSRKILAGAWKLDPLTNTLTIYEADGQTPLMVFETLDSAGEPGTAGVYERRPQ